MLAANRANWDARTAVHVGSRFYDVEGWLEEGRGPRPWEAEELGDVTGRTLLHLQCHLGLDTLAWARAGAEVTGLDFSPAAVEAASDIARRAGLEPRSRFVCADVHRAAEALGGATYDVVYVSIGALCWLPSVDRWAAQVGRLVRPGGRFYIHEDHPLTWAMADDTFDIENTYFEQPEPHVDDSDFTYTDGGGVEGALRSFEWNHGLGETVSALIRHGLRPEWLHEHPWTLWPRWEVLVDDGHGRWWLPPGRPPMPLSFSLLATRT